MADNAHDNDVDAALGSPLFVASLQLCQAAYCSQDNISGQVEQVIAPGEAGGSWSCEAVYGSLDNPNLAFIATFTDDDGSMTDVAVAFRGTTGEAVTDADIIAEMLEDLDVTTQVALPWSQNIEPDARISTGAKDAYDDIMGFGFGPQPLLTKLDAIYEASSEASPPRLLVVGHSLGGCLASLFAPMLATKIQAIRSTTRIVPVTFAAPTAGNEAFASYSHRLCPTSYRFTNTLDIVPHGWNGLSTLENIYTNCAEVVPMPPDFKAAVKVLSDSVIGKYKQTDRIMKLTGQCWLPPIVFNGQVSWYREALHQHHSTTYMALIGGTNLPGMKDCVPAGQVLGDD